MRVGQKMIEKFDSVPRVVHQKRPEKIDLIPGTVLLKKPLFQILERVEYVVDVDQDTGLQGGKGLKKVEIDVAACLGNMGRIYKEDIVSLQGTDEVEIDVLGSGLYYTRLTAVSNEKIAQSLRVRLDEGALNPPKKSRLIPRITLYD